MWYLNDKPIGNIITLGDRLIINPTREQYLAAGCNEHESLSPEQVSEAEQNRTVLDEEFESACQKFRQVCAQIKEAANLESFRGGFDEMTAFQQSPVYSTIQGLQLAMAWNAANELCKYTGSRVGYGQPEWWYKCWESFDESPADSVESEETEPPLDTSSEDMRNTDV